MSPPNSGRTGEAATNALMVGRVARERFASHEKVRFLTPSGAATFLTPSGAATLNCGLPLLR